MKPTKPDKPYIGFPLFAHNAGVWAKKVNGKFHYFGPWDDPQGALDRYIGERDFLYAGRTPPSRQNTVAALLAAFLGDKQNHLNTGDITENSYKEYRATCEVIEATFGKNRDIGTLTIEDFGTLRNALAKGKCKCNGIYRLDTLRSRLPPGEYLAVRAAIRDGKTTCKTSLGVFTVADLDALGAAAETGYKWRDIMGLRLALAGEICDCAGTLGPVTLKRRLTVARMVFVFANEQLDQNLRYKKPLQAPSKLSIRRKERERGKRLYEAAEIRKLVKAADPHLRAMILLGINCGFGPRDCCTMPTDAIDLKGGWHNYPRPKTEVDRRCPLWPETVRALKAVVGKREAFNGRVWSRHIVAREFTKLAKACKVRNLGHYSLRRTFETVGGTAEVNQAVIDSIMGHSRNDMASVYRQKVFDAMLRKCTDHVRAWFLGTITLE